MTSDEFNEFVVTYRTVRLGSLDFQFVLHWQARLMSYDLADVKAALDQMLGDEKLGFPMNDLPILLSYAEARANARKPQWKDPLAGKTVEPPSTAWNQKMLALGIIKKAEFNRREDARKAKS